MRCGLVLAFIGLSFLISFLLTKAQKKEPEIELLNPSAAMPLEIIEIRGENFGNIRHNSYVEISNSRLTSNSYISWNDTSIKVQIPQNIQNGLVHVVTEGGKSNARIFTNKQDIPVAVESNPQSISPTISSIKSTKLEIGDILTITGKNFGLNRGESQVLFSSPVAQSEDDNYISVFDPTLDYDFWSDQEIRVRVPDGAVTGKFFVLTDKGESNKINIQIDRSAGRKQYSDKRIYLISVNTDISDVVTNGDGTITVRIPLPPLSASQRKVEVTNSNPEPIIPEYNGTIVHQFPVKKNQQKKISATHNFVVEVYGINTSPVPNKITQLTQKNKQLYLQYLYADEIIQSNNEDLLKLSRQIKGKESNPYNIAKLFFNYMLENFKLDSELNNGDFSIENVLQKNSGDAYELVLTYCALCRSQGIPAMPVAGVLINSNQSSKAHWWTEIYFEKLGWIPVDVALAMGLDFEPFKKQLPEPIFYFGNIDAQHIVFSRGWNNIKSTQGMSKTVYRPKTYALQSIWEEASPEVQKYSSFWSDVQVLGIY